MRPTRSRTRLSAVFAQFLVGGRNTRERVSDRTLDSHFVVGRYNQAAFPLIDTLRREQHADAREQSIATRPREAHQ